MDTKSESKMKKQKLQDGQTSSFELQQIVTDSTSSWNLENNNLFLPLHPQNNIMSVDCMRCVEKKIDVPISISLGLTQDASDLGYVSDAAGMDVRNVSTNDPGNAMVAGTQSDQNSSNHSAKQLTSLRESRVACQLGLPKSHPLMQTSFTNWNQTFFINGWFNEEDFFIACRSEDEEARYFLNSLPDNSSVRNRVTEMVQRARLLVPQLTYEEAVRATDGLQPQDNVTVNEICEVI
jgi:hypothetical protein